MEKDDAGDIIESFSYILRGKVNELCEIPSQQEDEIPWVQRPMVESFVQKFDEPAEEFKIGGYPSYTIGDSILLPVLLR